MKQINEKILKINEKLPFGSKKVIAQQTGLTRRTIGRFFKGESLSLKNYKKIVEATKEILNEHKILIEGLNDI